MENNIILDKSKAFAVRIIKFYQYFVMRKKNLYCRNNYCEVARVLGLMRAKVKMHKAKQILYINSVYH